MSRSTTPGAIAEQKATLKRKFQELLQAVPTDPTSRNMLQAIGRVNLSNADSGVPVKDNDSTNNPTEGMQVKATSKRSRAPSKKTKTDSNTALNGAARSSVRKNKGQAPRRHLDDVSSGRIDSVLSPFPSVSAGPEKSQSLVVKLNVPREQLIAKMMEDKEAVEAAKILLSLRYGKW